MREELEVERSPLGVAGHRVQRVVGCQLCLAAGGRHVVLGCVGEDLAQILRAFRAAPVEQLQALVSAATRAAVGERATQALADRRELSLCGVGQPVSAWRLA